MSIVIKECTVNDWEAVMNISRLTFAETFGADNTPEDMQKYLDEHFFKALVQEEISNPDSIFYLAEYDGKVAGLCTLVLNPTEGPWGDKGIPEIVDLSVFIEFRGKGIGNKLMDIAENEASKISDMVYLGVGVHSGYGPAQRLYVSRGYNFSFFNYYSTDGQIFARFFCFL